MGLLLLVPATLAMGRLQLWILPRNAMGLPAGPPPFKLRIRDIVRVGRGMSRGDGRAVVEHLERVRSGTPFGAVEAVAPMPAERLEAVREGARKGTGRTTGFGVAAAGILVIPLMQSVPDSWNGMAPLVFVAIVMPLVVVLGVWPQVKRWTRGYLEWAEETGAEPTAPAAFS